MLKQKYLFSRIFSIKRISAYRYIDFAQVHSEKFTSKIFRHLQNYRQSTYIAKLEKQLDERNSNDLLRKLQDRERDVEHLRARLEAETAPKYEVEKLRRNLGYTQLTFG